jgi:di/tricarboxylate transporter
MTLGIALVLSLLLVVVVLFVLEWWSIDVVTLLVLGALVLSGVLTTQEAFSGFASDIVFILASVFVVSGALLQTGVMDAVTDQVVRRSGQSRFALIALVMAVAAFASALMNNTTTTAVLLPAVLTICRRRAIGAGQVLMPLAFASILGGTCTLIGTSTNVAASGFIERFGLPGFSLFEFLPVGLVMCAVGTLYMVTIGRWLLPRSEPADYTEEYHVRQYLSEIVLPVDSPEAGRLLKELPFSEREVTVLEIRRDRQRVYAGPDTLLEPLDILVVSASRRGLLFIKDMPGVDIKGDVSLGDKDLVGDSLRIAEAIVMPQSLVVGRTLKELGFRQRFGVTALAIHRRGHNLVEKLGATALKAGDVLLIQGSKEQLRSLQGNPDLWILSEIEHRPLRRRQGIYAITALLAAVVVGGLGFLPLSVAFLGAALACVVFKCVTAEEAYKLIDWRLLILIGGMTAFGVAMSKTGAAEYVARGIVQALAPLGIYAIMAGFVAITMALTQPMSNASAALVTLPIALSTASQLGADPRAFAVLVTLAASLSFITPLEPACLLVYGPGKYRFRDFVIVGLPLTVVTLVVLLLLVPLLWPLK